MLNTGYCYCHSGYLLHTCHWPENQSKKTLEAGRAAEVKSEGVPEVLTAKMGPAQRCRITAARTYIVCWCYCCWCCCCTHTLRIPMAYNMYEVGKDGGMAIASPKLAPTLVVHRMLLLCLLYSKYFKTDLSDFSYC